MDRDPSIHLYRNLPEPGASVRIGVLDSHSHGEDARGGGVAHIKQLSVWKVYIKESKRLGAFT